MNLVVLSDTHGIIEELVEILKIDDEIDKILHLGDFTKDAKMIQKLLGKEVISVKGNCDMGDNETPLELCIFEEGINILMVHGHKYGIKNNLNSLYYRGLELNADLILYGHSHVLAVDKVEDILMINPGSTSLPRSQIGKTYMKLKIKNGNIEYEILKI